LNHDEETNEHTITDVKPNSPADKAGLRDGNKSSSALTVNN